MVIRTNHYDGFLYPIEEINGDGEVILDNRDSMFLRKIRPGQFDLEKYIANRDDFLYHDTTTQAEKEFDVIIHQESLRMQEEACRAHFLEQGMPGCQPFLLQDALFSTRSSEVNYRYHCRMQR